MPDLPLPYDTFHTPKDKDMAEGGRDGCKDEDEDIEIKER